MRKLIFILGLFVCAWSFGQGLSPGIVASAKTIGASWDTTGIFSDGDTKGWYIADTNNYTTVGDTAISQWDDMSGTDNHLDMSNTTFQPKYLSTPDRVSFDGGYQYMAVASFVYSQPNIVYVVWKQVSYVTNDFLMRFRSSPMVKLTQKTNANTISATSLFYSTDEPTADTWVIQRFVWNGSSSKIQLNVNDAVTGDVGIGDFSYFRLPDIDNNVAAELEIREIIIRNANDSDATQANIMGYLNSKYSIY